MKKAYRGSFTVEASLIVPIILMMFAVLIYILFYYHDKNIMAGAAYETAVVGTERQDCEEEELERYFQRRVRGKLILFPSVQEKIQIEKESVTIVCRARKKRMKIEVSMSARRTEPEKFIRNIRKIKKKGQVK